MHWCLVSMTVFKLPPVGIFLNLMLFASPQSNCQSLHCHPLSAVSIM